MKWSHNAAQEEVSLKTTGPWSVLSTGITELSFTGYEADGTTETTVEADIHSVKCRVRVELPRETNGTRDVSCWAWLRAW